MNVPFISPPYTRAERVAVMRVMMGKDLADGGKKTEFETKFAEYIGVEYAIAVNSGTSALELSLQAAIAMDQMRIGDQIIVPSFTFTAVANAVSLAGLVPIFTDINPETMCMDPKYDELDPKIKGIIPVHTFGQQCVDSALTMARSHDLFMIEDCCEACGAAWFGHEVGEYGDAAVFSFTPTKNMTTGEGGMVVTDDFDLAATMKLISANGIINPSQFSGNRAEKPSTHLRDCVVAGHNYRMDEIHAAIGIVQLGKLDVMNAERRALASKLTYYIKQHELDVTLPRIHHDSTHSFQLYTIVMGDSLKDNRNDIVTFLNKSGIEAKVYFDLPIHLQEAFIGYPRLGELTHTEDIAKRVVSLPMHPRLVDNDLIYMADMLAEAIKS